VTLGDSDQVRIGEFAMAMGSPGAGEAANTNRSQPMEDYLLGQTVTTNVVTGRDTTLEFEIDIWQGSRNGESIQSWQYGTNLPYAFRVTVPINPGNSGGPLFNSRGEVIGINFYGGSNPIMQNYNHAIPINVVKDFVTQILETGKFERPWLGLDIIMPPYIQTAAEYVEFAERYRPNRIEVYGVRKDSPASKADVQVGDVILEVDGQEFKRAEDIRLYVFNLDIGTPVSLTISRKDGNTGRYKKLAKPVVIEVGPKRKFNAEFSV
jgi:serine protease Do